jgi:ubiquinone/menaquinone biosynthesis C-methylase UbiE
MAEDEAASASDPVAAGYDLVYGATPKAPTLRRLWREHACGIDFPEAFYHISFVTIDELTRIASELRLEAGRTFVDLACGMGGPALWLAHTTGARTIGVDLSPVAVKLATDRAAALALGAQARFVQGTFAGTGLEDASADAAVSEDALQYAPDKDAAFREAARILRTGGRFAFTAFELDAGVVRGLPVLGTDPVEDYRPALERAGFRVDTYERTRGWPQPTIEAYQALLDHRAELIDEMGEAAANALSGELTLTLQLRPYRSRVFVCATKT